MLGHSARKPDEIRVGVVRQEGAVVDSHHKQMLGIRVVRKPQTGSAHPFFRKPPSFR